MTAVEAAMRCRPPLSSGAAAVTRIAAGCALLAVWLLFFVFGLSGLEAARSQVLLYGDLRHGLADPDRPQPIGGVIDPGTPIALIEATRINLRYVVVEGTAAGDLRAGPGHQRDTPLPGQAGASLVYGRATAFGGPFGEITSLRRGDTIVATTGQGTFRYQVDGVRRTGDPLPTTLRSGEGRLTLGTAEGVSWRTGWAADRAVFVDATLQGEAQPAPPGRPAGVPKAERIMESDPGALVPLVLWLQILLLGSIAISWAVPRWGGAQAWLVCMPVILAGLWGATETAVQLLPNLV